METDEGVLAFVGRDGRADYVTASSLADLLDEAEPTPRLVVLNSCQSGAGGTTDLFSGTAAALAHSGIRAVAAMQFSISDTAAIEFARGFYTALAHGRGIDEAVRSGRIGILGMGRGTLEWVTPVLYLRGEDAQLFDVAPMPATAPVTAPAAVAAAATTATSASGPTTASGPTAASTATAASAKSTPPETPPRTVPTPATTATHTPDSGDLPSALLPVIRPEAAAAAGSAGMAAAAARANAARPFVMPADVAKGATPTPTVARTAPQPTVPAAPARPTTVSPPSTPPPSRTTPTTPMGVAAAATIGASTRPQPGPPRHPTPPGPPRANRPTPAPPEPKRTPTWRPWLVVALIAILAIAGAATLFWLRPWDGPLGGGETTGPTVGPQPAATVDVLGTEPEWASTGLSCNAGDTFELIATGSITQDENEESRVGPGGWLEDTNPGYQGQFGFPPGALIGRVDTVDPSAGFAFREDGTASYTCPAAGTLELGISDPVVGDNRGGFRVEVRRPAPEG